MNARGRRNTLTAEKKIPAGGGRETAGTLRCTVCGRLRALLAGAAGAYGRLHGGPEQAMRRSCRHDPSGRACVFTRAPSWARPIAEAAE